MQETATIIAHIMYQNGAILNYSTVLRSLDNCLEKAADGAFSLTWDSEDLMVAEFAQTKIILIAGHQVTPQSCFGLTIAVSPRDEDALANPTLPSQHVLLIQELVTQLAPPLISGGVLWQRAKAPISVEAVERIAEALSDKLAEMEEISSTVPHGARSIETAQWLPSSALALQL